jgi:multidrug efflux pump subunit AcrB
MDDHVPCPGGLPPTARKTAGRIWLGILAGCACIAAAALGWTRAHRAADDPKPAGLGRRELPPVTVVPGGVAQKDVPIDRRISRTQYQYTLQDADVTELSDWAPRRLAALRNQPELVDVATDQQSDGLQVKVAVDRQQAARLNVLSQAIDDTLYDAFGQRQVSTIFTQLNQYRVILEIEPQYQLTPESLNKIHVKSTPGQMVPLSAFAKVSIATAPLTIVHQGQFPAVTLSFNLHPSSSLGAAVQAIQAAEKNAILMIDFALDAERHEGLSPREAIYKACVIRFRPIMMTTLAALLVAVPLAIGLGTSSELRKPLGIAVVGGLVLSQTLTLYTTPVIYLAFESLGQRCKAWRRQRHLQLAPA